MDISESTPHSHGKGSFGYVGFWFKLLFYAYLWRQHDTNKNYLPDKFRSTLDLVRLFIWWLNGYRLFKTTYHYFKTPNQCIESLYLGVKSTHW